jgi:hypothetical protein
MQLVKKVAAAAALSLLVSAGVATTAEAQETDLSQIDALILEVQDNLLALAAQLGDVTENLGQQPGLNQALTAVGDLLDEGLVGLVQAILEAVN